MEIVFLLITVSALVLFYLGMGNDSKLLRVSAVWALISGALAWSGFLAVTDTMPPRILLILLGAIAFAVYTYRRGRRANIDSRYLLAIHVLRIPVELILYALFLRKLVPELMTFAGANFDVVMGISALAILLYQGLSGKALPRNVMLGWNVLGLVLLTTIVVLALLSSPVPIQQFAFDQPNVAVLRFPFVYLPALVVPLVYAAHALMIRRLLAPETPEMPGKPEPPETPE